MKHTITFKIDCGTKTCVDETNTNKKCWFLGSKCFGTVPVCMLFRGDNGDEIELKEINGWRQRCEECLTKALPCNII